MDYLRNIDYSTKMDYLKNMDFFKKESVGKNATIAGDGLVASALNSDYIHTLPWAIGVMLLMLYLRSAINAVRSPLSKIPGPWYAPWTSMHLSWGFAQGTIWKYVDKQHAKYGDVCRLGPRQIWVSGKDAMKDVLVKTDLPKVAMYAEISRDRFSPGLFGEIRDTPHRNLKKFLSPALTVSAVDDLDNFFKDCVSSLLKNYYVAIEKQEKKGQSTDLKTDLMRDLHCLALDIMGRSGFGRGFGQIDQVFDPSKIKTARDRAWVKIPDAIFDGQVNRYRFVYVKRFFRSLGWNMEFDWPKDMTRAISELIDERAAEDEVQRDQRRPDILHHMLTEGNRPDTGERMTNQDIIDQMSELLLAGSETTSGTIGFMFLELARNPEVRKKLLKSLPARGPKDDVVDSKTVRESPEYEYLEAVIKENLRMHPIASEMGRRCKENSWEVDGYYIPPYTVVSASYRQLHLDERYWPEPNRFWPERWLEGDAREGAPEPDMDAYYPFSGGKHSCIGKNFAYAEIRTASANILTRFDVQEAKNKKLDFRQYITMQFDDGCYNVNLVPRWKHEKTETEA